MGDRRVDVRREAVIAADPDAVWAIVAAAERQAEWFPGMVTSTVKDDVRTVVAASGAIFLEEILAIDDDTRCFEYRITGPLHLDHHRGRITVQDDPGGTRVVYEQELEPKALAYVLDGALGDALVGLRDLVTDGQTSRAYHDGDA
ncbi:uncharacterized protein METZ01_LOCUS98004 [marine metagenome]|uniref:Coenzyme Q-binding protein COQ10 START domain-containing protein n=1 Tax=marine metagenome TaxID=408172 RepID=A0A381VXX9_9ZZZZ